MVTNADQLSSAKMAELQKRIKLKKPLVIAVCEVKPKNPHERAEPDYDIPGYSIHQVNLDSSIDRCVVLYTCSSLDKSVIQIIPEIAFEEVCLLEIRLRGGDLLLKGCLYRNPTPSISSDRNNDNLTYYFITYLERAVVINASLVILITKTSTGLWVIMEFCRNGSLLQFLRNSEKVFVASWRKETTNLDEKICFYDLLIMAIGITKGMNFLHGEGIVSHCLLFPT